MLLPRASKQAQTLVNTEKIVFKVAITGNRTRDTECWATALIRSSSMFAKDEEEEQYRVTLLDDTLHDAPFDFG